MAKSIVKVECRTPTPGKKPVRIDQWKFELVRSTLARVVPRTLPGVLFSELPELVAAELTADDLERIGSLMWYVTTVKLELEVRGELQRVAGSSPQRLIKR